MLRATFAVLAWVASTAMATEAPRTLRVDYFHTGGQGVEIFALDRVSVEPLPWPGHPVRTVDSGEPGVYRFEVRDGNGQLLFARGFASIFGEWITTAEASTSHRTFHESLRFPEPAGPVEVTVLRRGADQSFGNGDLPGNEPTNYQLLLGYSWGLGAPLDSDGDGVADTLDNCPFVPNANQMDTDGDGIGNVCDDTPSGSGDPVIVPTIDLPGGGLQTLSCDALNKIMLPSGDYVMFYSILCGFEAQLTQTEQSALPGRRLAYRLSPLEAWLAPFQK